MINRIEICILVTGLALTGWLAQLNHIHNIETAVSEFDNLAQAGVQGLETRMDNYVQSLKATAAYLRRSDTETRAELEQYVADLDSSHTLPGISGIGLIVPEAASQKQAFEEKMVADGYAQFKIHPDTANQEMFVIKHIFPLSPNLEASGLDISFEEGRRAAAMRARETGEPQLTPRIILVQNSLKEPGFLLLLPLFQSKMDRRDPDAFRGWVYAPFNGRNLLQELVLDQGRTYHISVFDGPNVDPDALIYSSVGPQTVLGKYSEIKAYESFGRTWTLQFKSTPIYDQAFPDRTTYIILAAGALVTLMLLFVLRNMRLRSDGLREMAHLRMRQIEARESENRSLIENALTPIFLLDKIDQVLFANQAALDCFGYTETAVQGLDFAQLVQFSPDGNTEEKDTAQGVTQSGEPLLLDLQRNVWMTANGEPRVTAIVRDITAETAAINEIEGTRALYDLALQGSEIGVFEIDLVTGQSEVSDTWRRIMGYEKVRNGLNARRAFLARVHPDDFGILQRADAECISGKTERSFAEYRIQTSEGEWRWMQSNTAVASRDAEGNALRLVGTQIDVTRERHARYARETSEKQVRQIMAAAPIGMALMDNTGQFIEVNSALCILCGASEEKLKADHRLEDFIADLDIEAVTEQLKSNSPTDTYKAEFPLVQSDGNERWCLFHVSATYDHNTHRHLLIAQIIDITEERRMDRLKDEFVSTVSHELRTPLTSIKGALGLIIAGKDSASTATNTRLLEIAGSNADRLTAIVNDILDMEKISSGEVTFEIQNVNMNRIIEQVLMDISPFALAHKNTIRVEVPDKPLMVHVDEARTKQVLSNLLSNACKYSHDDSEIVITAKKENDRAKVTVWNTGPGINKAFRSQIFTAFSQSDGSATRDTGGTGLGLNISQQIVKRHGGDIGFESVEDQQTEFWFTSPLADAATAMLGNRSGLIARHKKQRATVLHLEDDHDFAEVVQSGLEPYVNVIHITNIMQARALLGLMHLDVIIIDWGLPDGDASVLMDEIKTIQPAARILGLSAASDRAPDDRLVKNMVKTKTDLSAVLQVVIETSENVSNAS